MSLAGLLRARRPAGGLRALITCLKWPEEDGSAAGVRTLGIVRSLVAAGTRVTVTAASEAGGGGGAASEGQARARTALRTAGASTACLPPNDSPRLAALLGSVRPGVVVFDRLACEEMFSHGVRAWAEGADGSGASGGFLPGGPVTVLDMQDCHSVRAAREAATRGRSWGEGLAAALGAWPDASSTLLQREMAAVRRSDCVWAVSDSEARTAKAWAGDQCGSDHGALVSTVGFAMSNFPPPRPLEQRSRSAAMIGTFLHAPNLDAVRWAVHELWPMVAREARRLDPSRPAPRLAVYGSHMTDKAVARVLSGTSRSALRDAGITLEGFAPSPDVLGEHRILFAPLRFGAGVKGKVLDAWRAGTPVVTTSFGAEGICQDAPSSSGVGIPKRGGVEQARWSGFWQCDSAELLATAAAELLTHDEMWQAHADRAQAAARAFADPARFEAGMEGALQLALDPEALLERRRSNHGQTLLWQSQLRATSFMSRFIELKEQSRKG